jgi:primosomal protein N' (replication factor Y)
LARLPPLSYQALLRAEAHARENVQEYLHAAAGCFPAGESRVFGPMPAIMEKVSGRYRMYLMIQSDTRAELHRQIDAWQDPLRTLPSGRKVRWMIDIDPQEL